nr:hypothetical protein [Rhizobium sp. AC27/96]
MSPQYPRKAYNLVAHHHIGDEPFVARGILACDNDCLTYLRIGRQLRFDLAELDPVSADLDLVVVAAEKLEIAIRPPAHEIPGPVDPGIWNLAERIGDEPLCRQLGPVQIAASDTGSADPQFPGDTDRAKPAMGINDIDMRVRHRAPDRDGRTPICRFTVLKRISACRYGRFGRPITVQDLKMSPT